MISQGLVWVPKYFKFEKTMAALIEEQGLRGLTFEKGPDTIPGLTKPTMYRTNEFTWAFQEIVNTYGIPTYKEVNPAVFTIVSFPFLFGVMFGDIMHGTLLFVFASYLCLSKREHGTLAAQLAPIRYLFLLMGVFAIFNGLIYNDFTSATT